jgi:low molecular weight protein-tyrosine phosphatase
VAPERFQVVFICTGNRFRSAIAEALTRRLTEGLPVDVSSAGTLDLGAVGVLPEALELAPELGVDLSSHRARCVRDVDLGAVDLVLGFERVHLATAVIECGAARDRTFTLPELVSLVSVGGLSSGGDPVEQARGVVHRAAEAQDSSSRLELADPLGGPPELFRHTARELQGLTAALVAALFGERTGGHEPAARSRPPASGGGEGEGQSTPPMRG